MNPHLPLQTLQIKSLEKYHVTMTKEEVAEALGLPRHIIAPLSRAGLIEPLGHPQKYCVKRYSRDVLAQQIADVNWLHKVGEAIYRHWRRKNARKRAKLAKVNSNPNSASAEIEAGKSATR